VKLSKSQIQRVTESIYYQNDIAICDFIRQQIAEMCSPEMVNTQTSKQRISL